MKTIKDIARIVRFAIASTPDKDLWTHPLEDVDKARPDDTHYIGELMAGEEKGKPVKETFETLMAEARVSWSLLCELFAALLFYIDAAIMDGDESSCAEYNICIREVIFTLNEKFGEDKASWSRFVNFIGKVKDVNFIKCAEKAKKQMIMSMTHSTTLT